MPRSSSLSFVPDRQSRASRRANRVVGGLDLHRARDDVRLQLVDLALEGRIDLAVELVVRGQRDAVVLQRAQVARVGGERLVRGTGGDGLLDRAGDVLDHGGQEDVAVLLGALAPVLVHPDHRGLAAGRLGDVRGAQAGAAGDRHDHVGALCDERVGDRLALVLVGERLGEGAVLRRLGPAEHLHLLALLLVVVRDTVGEAVHEHGDRRDLQAAVGGDLAGLGEAGREVPGQEGGLIGGELHRVHVGRALDGAIHDAELLVGVLCRDLLGGAAHQAADREDEVALLGHETAQVGLVVRLGGGGHVLGLDVALRSLGGLHAGPGRRVERPVVDAAGVRHHAGLVGSATGGAAAASARGLIGSLATGRSGERQPARRENRNDPLPTYWAQDALLPLHTDTSR
jgi:hypothetical protein